METSFNEAWNGMIKKLEGWLNDFIGYLPNFILAILVFVVSYIVAKYVRKVVSRLLKRSSMQTSMVNLIGKLTAVAIIFLGLFLILGILDLSKTLNAILAGAGVAGLAVGLALQGALANTYSGIVLSYIKHIKYGDWISVKDFEGEVVNIDLRAVTLKQADNNLVYIPNKQVIENAIKNYSTTSQSRVILECGVAYNSNLKEVRQVVLKALMSNFQELENQDDIIFLYTEFNSSSIDFEVRFRIDSTSALEVANAKTEALISIKDAFDENGITIPFPIRTLDISEKTIDTLVKKTS
nr:mechanosensitive ion channel [uncultured Allomuricauda sp.]